MSNANFGLNLAELASQLPKILQADLGALFGRKELQEVPLGTFEFEAYREILPAKLYNEVVKLSKPLAGAEVVMLNATPYGGGVAEIFKSMIPLMRSLGIKVHWHVMPASDDFFEVTKNFHNALQGADYELGETAKALYLGHNQRTATLLRKISADVYEIHDPQPAAVGEFAEFKNTIWRCHIDTSTPNRAVWDFVRPFIEHYDQLIFTMPEFAHNDLPKQKLNFIAPTIDAFSVKNRPLGREFAVAMMQALGIDSERPLVTQVSRFDPWKDPKGVIDAYRLAKKKVPKLQLALVGSMASDDPEGQVIYQEVEDYAAGDPDIFLYTNLTGVGEVEVNAFQTFSEVLLQKSTREGFGLTVTEGLWKGHPVIGGNVGGIKLQIRDGKTGYLVNSVEECADRIVELVKSPAKSVKMGEAAHEYVRTHFLHPRLIRDHLRLYHKLLKV